MKDQEIIIQLKALNHKAFEELVNELHPKVYNTCLGLLQNEQDAEDTTQEVFIRVFQSIHTFKGNSKLSTWIYRIAVTKSLELIRTKKSKKRFAFLQPFLKNEGGEFKTESAHFYHPGVQLEEKERAAILFKAIDQLPVNQKTAFLLHKMEDLPYSEIAQIMRVSVSAVESLMVRAKQNLKHRLGAYYEKNEK